ncbi:hypothetical protein [Citrobacter portucalensis]|uniref:hypothetical protein n=1 Tax=Citrobacter portucalensis TaxID=1639133 RepID=UPI0018A59781|nr:hypothetical protein [Citrobacter portucalensis]BBV41344.1 hypothetical protein STW0522CIT26_28160 [Citrobacter portucalensis]BBV46325.1 hypothetical protein STW0522CIT27_27650 [Citrobacter portucalensis]BBV51607.1 hypothetical protein STW0522CIT30_28670 [Citrobacter portucalensis]BBW12339.1 hypothetical protein STN0717CIT27_28150 [Citrobacter portucalensis]BBW17391.1 hypothetical protein STN0717CIT36_28150 [Citrobacter portucalensis]
MWLIALLIFIVIVYLFIKHTPSKQEREYEDHDTKRREASERILSQEKNLDKTFPKNHLPQDKPKQQRKKKPKKHTIRGVELDVLYMDSKGDLTHRQIRVINYTESTQKIYAWCSLRDDFRTFFTYKMTNIIDINTGEVVDDLDEYLSQKINS